MLKSTLLATKLHRPSPPAARVQRPSLIQKLHESITHDSQLVLVSAPAGFGKTTCISEWLSTLEDWPIAWLSLDTADNDPGRFLAYFIAALQKIDPNLGREIFGVLQAGQLPSDEIVSTNLINDMLAVAKPFLLILDDFHVIQDLFILAVLETIIRNLPPLLHLVLITREDPPLPLARLRANKQLTEIRAKDLRFTSQDAACLLNDVLGLSLSPTDITVLETKTEGWVVGLQLAALSLRGHAYPSHFIARLSGNHRFILSYLTEQVLDQQSQEVHQFLLQTSILDKLNGELCDAVTGRRDGRFLLEQLFNANLFLVPLDDEGQWYRYHHLFADLLQDRQRALLGEETAVLHQRASQWYRQANMIDEAVVHALAATDYAMVVELLEGHALKLIMRGYVKTVNGWVEAIPEQWLWQSHRTNLAFAWMHLLRGAYSQATPYLERLESSFSGSQVDEQEGYSLKADWLVMQSLLSNMEGKFAEGLARVDEALAIIPEKDNRVWSLAYFGLATAHQAMGKYQAAVEAYQLAIQQGQVADNLVAEMLSVSGLATMAFEGGQLQLAFEIASPVSNRIEQSGALPPIATVVYGILGEVYYQWHQITEARQYYQRALSLSTLGGYKSGMVNCRVLLSRLCQLEGDLMAADHQIKEAAALTQAETPDYVRQEVAAQQVCVYLAQNRPAAAQMALQGEGFSFEKGFAPLPLPPDQGVSHSLGLLVNSSLCFLLYQARTRDSLFDLETGIALADRLITGSERSQSTAVVLEALLLRAQMYDMLGNHRAGQADYINALKLAEPEGFLSVFIEQGVSVAEAVAKLLRQNKLGSIQPGYIERLLTTFSGSLSPDGFNGVSTQQAETEPLIEPLTDRELEVLGLMAEGLKYKEIAARLVISLNTVRYHVKAIYGKLNVNNRTQAIAKARQRQIL